MNIKRKLIVCAASFVFFAAAVSSIASNVYKDFETVEVLDFSSAPAVLSQGEVDQFINELRNIVSQESDIKNMLNKQVRCLHNEIETWTLIKKIFSSLVEKGSGPEEAALMTIASIGNGCGDNMRQSIDIALTEISGNSN